MIVETEVFVNVRPINLSHFLNKGYKIDYEFDSRGRKRYIKEKPILVKIEDLTPFSNAEITTICEDCGIERKVMYHTVASRANSQFLKTGETLCVKCANKRHSGINSAAYKHGNILYPQYRNNARKRKIDFNLSVDEFEKLIPGKCFYCGEASNGIDRYNSNIGYEFNNCVPCCSQCNFIKNNTPPELFIKKIVNMYNTFKINGLI